VHVQEGVFVLVLEVVCQRQTEERKAAGKAFGEELEKFRRSSIPRPFWGKEMRVALVVGVILVAARSAEAQRSFCASQNRLESEVEGARCGECAPGYASASSSGKCRFQGAFQIGMYTKADPNPLSALENAIADERDDDSERGDNKVQVAFADLHGRGVLDAYVCTGTGRYELEEFTGHVLYMENVGSANSPQFVVPSDDDLNPFEDVSFGTGCAIVFYDWDGDSLLDAFVHEQQFSKTRDIIRYFHNQGEANSPKMVEVEDENPFRGLVFGLQTVLSFFDVNEDGVPEAFVCNDNNQQLLQYSLDRRGVFKRDGNGLFKQQHGFECGSAFADLNGDSLVDAVVFHSDDVIARRTSKISFFQNFGERGRPDLRELQDKSNPFNDFVKPGDGSITATFVDLFGLGRPDLVIGYSNGSRFEYLSSPDESVSSSSLESSFVSILGPRNPFQQAIDIDAYGTNPRLAFADFFGRNRSDVYAAVSSGAILGFRNDGFGEFSPMADDEHPFGGSNVKVTVDNFASVAFGDLTNDGLTDAVTCDRSGNLQYFKNVGNETHPVLEDHTNEFMFGVVGDSVFPLASPVGANCQVLLRQSKSTDLMDLVVGVFTDGEGGKVEQFINFGTSEAPQFRAPGLAGPNTEASVVLIEGLDDNNVALKIFQPVEIPMDLFSSDLLLDLAVLDPIGRLIPIFNDDIRRRELQGGSGDIDLFESELEDTGLSEVLFPGSSLAFFDLEDDKDYDALIGRLSEVSLGLNVAVDCQAQCSGRGLCITSSTENVLRDVVADLQDLNDNEESLGVCWCPSEFAGESCQRCADNRYGKNCEFLCPAHSGVVYDDFQFEFPSFPTINQCICNPSFLRLGDECMCPPGSGYNSATQTCEICPVGTFKNETSLSGCMPCTKVKDLTTTVDGNSTSAEQCMCRGSFEEDELGECACPLGFGYLEFGLVCQRCPPGSFSSNVSLDACSPCPSGRTTFLEISDSEKDCKPLRCPVGTERDEERNCIPCRKNSYGIAGEQCISCPEKRPITVNEGSVSIDQCVSPEGSVELIDGSVLSCSDKILDGMVRCEKPGLHVRDMPLLAGRWRISNASIEIFECKGSQCVKETEPYCAQQHLGIRCQGCEDGHAIHHGTCQLCDAELTSKDRGALAGWIILALIIIFAPSVYLIFVYIWSKRDSNQDASGDLFTRLLPRTMFKLFLICRTKFRIIIAFWQTLLVYLTALTNLGKGNGLATIVSFDMGGIIELLEVGCAFQDNGYRRLVVYTAIPLFAFLFITLMAFVFKSIRGHAVWLLLFLSFLVYPGVGNAIFSSFLYEEFPAFPGDMSPEKRHSEDVAIVVGDDTSNEWRIYAWVMIFIYPVGIFMMFIFFTFRTYSGKENRYRKATDFLRRPYKDEFFFFESYELLRRLLMTSVFLVILQLAPTYARDVYLLLCVIFLLILLKLQPYKIVQDQLYAEISLAIILFSALGTTMTDEREAVGIIAGVGIAMQFLVTLGVIWWEFRELQEIEAKDQKQAPPTSPQEEPAQPPKQVEKNMNDEGQQNMMIDDSGSESEVEKAPAQSISLNKAKREPENETNALAQV